MLSITAHALPGGQSIKTGGPPFVFLPSNRRMIGIPEASPVFSIPLKSVTPRERPCCILPMRLSFSTIAFRGQRSAQPPQEWHTSSKTTGAFLIKASALNLQKSTHFLHPLHRFLSTTGILTAISSSRIISGLKNRCPLGSSTSQSI
ncbi:hypothetical protein SDC9_181139 [bioreactor metagenome]|uniref:Uncharacterized protein n=1 Tax=bioreactor metagenome TaxID=1076179 RepID=A0A645H6E6_9ZZZZ